MQRQRGELVPIGEAFGALLDGRLWREFPNQLSLRTDRDSLQFANRFNYFINKGLIGSNSPHISMLPGLRQDQGGLDLHIYLQQEPLQDGCRKGGLKSFPPLARRGSPACPQGLGARNGWRRGSRA